MTEVNGKLQQSNPGRMKDDKGHKTSGMQIWVTSPGKEPRLAEVLAKQKETQNG